MSIARINLSHGSREDHTRLLKEVKHVQSQGIAISSLFDTRGCEIRTGDVTEPISISEGQEVLFCSTAVQHPEPGSIQVGYDGFAEDVRETDKILIDNGELEFEILRTQVDGSVVGLAKNSGSIGSRRHINLPGADIDLPSITDKDWSDIQFAAEQGVDVIALSFVRSEADIEDVRSVLSNHGSTAKIVSKIENQQALDQLDPIITASDAVMVARGDLGAEIEFVKLPKVQADIVSRCHQAGTPVIVATHMLESMRSNMVPTRAEITDVSMAASQFVDATMLSAETAVGKHPVEAVDTMCSLLEATEYDLPNMKPIELHDPTYQEIIDVSKTHQHAPITVYSSDAVFLRSLNLIYGVSPKCS